MVNQRRQIQNSEPSNAKNGRQRHVDVILCPFTIRGHTIVHVIVLVVGYHLLLKENIQKYFL
jgi:hypothetical protein